METPILGDIFFRVGRRGLRRLLKDGAHAAVEAVRLTFQALPREALGVAEGRCLQHQTRPCWHLFPVKT